MLRRNFLLLICSLLCAGPALLAQVSLDVSIGLADNYCFANPVDPNADCGAVPVTQTSLTVDPGLDGEILLTCLITNNGGSNVVEIELNDTDRGLILPRTQVTIAKGTTETFNFLFPAESMSRLVMPDVRLTYRLDNGSLDFADDTYTLDVPNPDLGVVEWGVGRSRDADCTQGKSIGNCNYLAGQHTATVGGRDSVSVYVRWNNEGTSTIDVVSFSDTKPGPENAELSDRTIDLLPGMQTIGSSYFLAPDAPGTYNYVLTLTATDYAGNTNSVDLNYTIVVEGPDLGVVEWGVGRSRDADCTQGKSIGNCNYLAGQHTATVGGRDSVSFYVRWNNEGVDVIDVVSFSDTKPGPENAELSDRTIDLLPGMQTIGSSYFLAPDAPGTYNYTLTLTATDRAGNTNSVDLN